MLRIKGFNLEAMAPGIAWVCEKVSRQPNFAAISPKIKFCSYCAQFGASYYYAQGQVLQQSYTR